MDEEQDRPPQRRAVFQGRVLDVGIDTVTLPNGRRAELEIVRHPGGAAVVALDADDRVCLLRQYRHAAGGWLFELPAGKRDHNEDPAETAARELQEEAGVVAASWQEIGTVVPSPAIVTETIWLYLARRLSPIATAHEADEVIDIRWLPLDEALTLAQDSAIVDAKTIVGLFRAAAFLRRTPG